MVVLREVTNMFWGVTLDVGKRYSQTVENSFHVSMAALEPNSSKEPVSLMIQHEKAEFLLCTLMPNTCLQQQLDLNFTEGEEVTFFINGKGVVHMTGYLLEDDKYDDECLASNLGSEYEDESVDDEDMSEDDMDSSDEEEYSDEEEIPVLVNINDISDDEEDEWSPTKVVKRKKEQQKGQKKKLKKKESSEEEEDDDEEEEDDSDEEMVEMSDRSDSSLDEEEVEDEEAELDGSILKELENKKKKKKSQQEKENGQPKSSKKEQTVKEKEPEKKKKKKNKKKKNKNEEKVEPTPGNKNENKKTQQLEKQTAKGQTPKGQTPKGQTPKGQTPKGQKIVLQGGTVVEELRVGNGPEAKSGKMAHVYYVGKLQNGTQFDSCTTGKPFKFKLGKGEVIKGWDSAVQGMKVGSKRKITVPPSQGYGNQRAGPIPPNSTLIFEVQLKAVS